MVNDQHDSTCPENLFALLCAEVARSAEPEEPPEASTLGQDEPRHPTGDPQIRYNISSGNAMLSGTLNNSHANECAEQDFVFCADAGRPAAADEQPEASTSGQDEPRRPGGEPQIGIIMGSDSDLNTMAAAEEV